MVRDRVGGRWINSGRSVSLLRTLASRLQEGLRSERACAGGAWVGVTLTVVKV